MGQTQCSVLSPCSQHSLVLWMGAADGTCDLRVCSLEGSRLKNFLIALVIVPRKALYIHGYHLEIVRLNCYSCKFF